MPLAPPPRRVPWLHISISCCPTLVYHTISYRMYQPKRRGTGGGGSGDDLFVRELVEPEKSVVLNSWKQYAKQDGGEKFVESIQILNDMVGTVQQQYV